MPVRSCVGYHLGCAGFNHRNQLVPSEFGDPMGQCGGILRGLTLCLGGLNEELTHASPGDKADRAQL